MSIYDVNLPHMDADKIDERECPFDCDGCHRKFTLGELHAFALPFLNRGEQKGKIECPACGHKTRVHFAADTRQ